jgi:hypothetical protein
MDPKERLLELEEAFWTGDAGVYRQNLTDNALMVFPQPAGVLTRDQTLETITAGPRWAAVDFDDVHLVRLTDDAAVLTYKASAHRPDDDSAYAPLASSVYVRQGGAWTLAFHQQTPSRKP